jgi:hypothetical protein
MMDDDDDDNEINTTRWTLNERRTFACHVAALQATGRISLARAATSGTFYRIHLCTCLHSYRYPIFNPGETKVKSHAGRRGSHAPKVFGSSGEHHSYKHERTISRNDLPVN